MLCGELAAESLKVNEAERVPAAAGANDTVTPQLAPAARLEPQLVLIVKSAALAPLKETL